MTGDFANLSQKIDDYQKQLHTQGNKKD